jgi:hypothetical protein
MTQPQEYYGFADQRVFLGIPNFMDVATSVAFLPVGLAGLWLCLRRGCAGARWAWVLFFAGLAAVGVGSAYFHWRPCDATLVWDRLPMTIAFMGLFVAVLSEHVSLKLENILLGPALVLGVASVVYWRWSQDLRWYGVVQYMPMLAIPATLVLFRGTYSHRHLFWLTLGGYLLAKLAEAGDRQIFAWTHDVLSGHSAKHLVAAAGCLAMVLMLTRRQSLPPQAVATHPAAG